jgi:hypothetical protein
MIQILFDFSGCGLPDFYRQVVEAETRKLHRAFVDALVVPIPHPNPLRILMRAVNLLRLCRPIRQPRWRAGRWRSTT